MPILGDFAVKYSEFASELGVSMDDLYQALVDTAENTVSVTSFYHLPVHSSWSCSLLIGIEVTLHHSTVLLVL